MSLHSARTCSAVGGSPRRAFVRGKPERRNSLKPIKTAGSGAPLAKPRRQSEATASSHPDCTKHKKLLLWGGKARLGPPVSVNSGWNDRQVFQRL
jgi:hypothetical protein